MSYNWILQYLKQLIMKQPNLKIISLLILFIVLTNETLVAQFNTIVPTVPTKEAIVFTKDGQQVRGKVATSMIMNGVLKSLSIKDESGVKHKFKAADVTEVRAKLTAFAKLVAVSEAHTTNGGTIKQVKSIINASQDDIWKKDLVIFYQIEVKPGKFGLAQLLNPGTNTVISVYPAPNTKGNGEQYYFAVKGDQVTKVVKGSYAKEVYGLLFGDCEAYISEYPVHKKLDVGDFPRHITEYNQTCAPK